MNKPELPAEITRAARELVEEARLLPLGEREEFILARTVIAEEIRHSALEQLRDGGSGPVPAEELPDEVLAVPPPDIHGYPISRQLGRGGLAAVFLAWTEGEDEPEKVAIKVMRDGADAGMLKRRLANEARILASLDHPHVIAFRAQGETRDGRTFLALGYVGGITLKEWLVAGQHDLRQRLDVFEQVAAAMAYCHEKGVIHGDVTANNILVDREGRAKLIDFGIARHSSDIGADIFGMGEVLGQLASRNGEPELLAIADRATKPAADNGFGSVEELLTEVRNFRQGRPVASYSSGRLYRLGKHLRRWRWAIAGAATAIIVAEAAS